ncbi:hypothetical protein [Desulfitobacterium hafniense]|uniref:hypothetical protein n=1 Tax=Desulfitobacterium hafniense TaxID=49338 RepID=UPI00037D9CCC|nr:hypothetical protein [Desulfitobacterium hafniense]
MKAYIGIKYHHDCRNRVTIEKIASILEDAGYETSCIIRDKEKWGSVTLAPNELMEATFKEIDSSNVVVIDVTEKGAGLGIESGYACKRNTSVHSCKKRF